MAEADGVDDMVSTLVSVGMNFTAAADESYYVGSDPLSDTTWNSNFWPASESMVILCKGVNATSCAKVLESKVE